MDEVFASFRPAPPVAAHAQIEAFLRREILAGSLPPGARLPTTAELASRWGVTITAIQAALGPLVKEGLLLRRPRVGTIVRERAPGLRHLGLYRPSDAQREGGDHFARRLAGLIAARAGAAGVAVSHFVDLRPETEQTAPPPDLQRAIRDRQLDAVIATECNRRIAPWLGHLPVPSAAMGSDRGSTEVTDDHGQFARAGVACLAGRGCRRIGLVSALPMEQRYADGSPHLHNALHDGFRAEAAAHGLETRAAWIRTTEPGVYVHENDAERYGYDSAHAICGGDDRPDGLLVYTDLVARGVVMALLELKGAAPPAPRLVVHRNRELGLFAPLPVDVLESSITASADALLAMIARQREGRPTAPVLLPFTLVRHPE